MKYDLLCASFFQALLGFSQEVGIVSKGIEDE